MKKNIFDLVRESLVIDAHAARTFASDPVLSHTFQVTIGSDTTINFKGVSGIGFEYSVIEYQEGATSDNPVHKLPGRSSVSEITFQRGMYAQGQGAGTPSIISKLQAITSSGARTTVTLQVYDRFGAVVRTFTFDEAWFSKYELGDFDATSDEVLIETLTMQYENFSSVAGSGAGTSNAAPNPDNT